MAKYGQYSRRPALIERPWRIHPIWRGIGCLFMILIPILAYAGAVVIIREDLSRGWMPVPPEFARAVTIPLVGSVSYLLARLVVAVILALAGFVLLTILYSLLYGFLGPSRYGPLDATPQDSLPKISG